MSIVAHEMKDSSLLGKPSVIFFPSMRTEFSGFSSLVSENLVSCRCLNLSEGCSFGRALASKTYSWSRFPLQYKTRNINSTIILRFCSANSRLPVAVHIEINFHLVYLLVQSTPAMMSVLYWMAGTAIMIQLLACHCSASNDCILHP